MPIRGLGLRVMCPSEAPTPRNVTMYLNYHYVCKLPAHRCCCSHHIKFKSTRTRGNVELGKRKRGAARVVHQGIWKREVKNSLSGVGEEKGVIIWELGDAGSY